MYLPRLSAAGNHLLSLSLSLWSGKTREIKRVGKPTVIQVPAVKQHQAMVSAMVHATAMLAESDGATTPSIFGGPPVNEGRGDSCLTLTGPPNDLTFSFL